VRLVHEDDPELSRQLGDIVERPSVTGSYIAGRPARPVPAAFAAMAAVHRTMTAPRLAAKHRVLALGR
jgi:hypothetical protein